MVFYHLQHYFAIDDCWRDIPHINGGCSTSKSDILEVYDRLINLNCTRVSDYRIVLSGRSDKLNSYCRSVSPTPNFSFIQLKLF